MLRGKREEARMEDGGHTRGMAHNGKVCREEWDSGQRKDGTPLVVLYAPLQVSYVLFVDFCAPCMFPFASFQKCGWPSLTCVSPSLIQSLPMPPVRPPYYST
jgi:hypothetical protein